MSEAPVLIPTPVGPARATIDAPAAAHGLICLGHGAGGGIDAPDLVAVASAATAAGWAVARLEQPYRVAGRRAPATAAHLDTAFSAAVAVLRERYGGPLVTGGRSSGGRVACRTAAATSAAAVVCLAFPLRPPRRPDVSRADELLAPRVPVLVVQGDRDPFGAAEQFPAGPDIVAVSGDHALRRAAAVAGEIVVDWLRGQRLA
jgi:predicted alpha/beta-hydrolase family hydrolase